eukprot:COSAG05_NODE_3098_length_2323_cov_21.130845_2_plen_133_part_00
MASAARWSRWCVTKGATSPPWPTALPHSAGSRLCIGVAETDERHGRPDFKLERERAMTAGRNGQPVHDDVAVNLNLLNEVCFIPFRRQAHEIQAMITEIVRQFGSKTEEQTSPAGSAEEQVHRSMAVSSLCS